MKSGVSDPYFMSSQIYQNFAADLSNFNRPLSFSYAHRTYSRTSSTRPRKATFTTRPVCLRAAEPCHRSGAQRGFYVTGDQREASRGSTRNCQEYFAKRSFLDGVVTTSVTVRLLCGWKVRNKSEFKIIRIRISKNYPETCQSSIR